MDGCLERESLWIPIVIVVDFSEFPTFPTTITIATTTTIG
jgi:hypothetical protein